MAENPTHVTANDGRMLVHQYTAVETDPFERGRALGTRFSGQIATSLEGYWRLFAAKHIPRKAAVTEAKRMLDVIAAWSPALSLEVAGLAAGAGLEDWESALMNGRTEIAALAQDPGPGECSTAVHLPADGSAPRTIQTWDWFIHLANEALVWRYTLPSGRTVHSFTEFGILGKIGINDAGLGSHMNMLNHVRDGGDAGVPLHLIARRIHDEASSIEDAVEIAHSARVSASTVLTVVSYRDDVPRAACIELSPAGVAVLPAPPGETLLHTNHFLDPELAKGEGSLEMENTLDRFAQLDQQRSAVAEPDLHRRATRLVDSWPGGGPLCVFEVQDAAPDLSWETKITIGLDFERTRLRYQPGTPALVEEGGWHSW